jgi:expansin
MRKTLFMVMVTLIAAAGIHGAVDDGSVLHNGEATFYGDGGGGNCGFPGEEQPQFHGAMNQIDYDSAAVCGAWVHITGPKGEVTAFIDDRCPECKEGDIDLGPGTFEAIADRALGRVPIQWRYVEGPVEGPIAYYWQTGSSVWHIAVQIRNHRYAITSVEIANAGSDWLPMNRSYDNYFVLAGGINSGESGPFRLRVTDIFGRQLVDTGLVILEGEVVTGTTNFDPVGVRTAERMNIPATRPRSVTPFCTLLEPVLSDRTGLFDIYTLSGRCIGKRLAARTVEQLMECGPVEGVVIVRRVRPKRGNGRSASPGNTATKK